MMYGLKTIFCRHRLQDRVAPLARMGVPGRSLPEQNVVRAEGVEPSWAV